MRHENNARNEGNVDIPNWYNLHRHHPWPQQVVVLVVWFVSRRNSEYYLSRSLHSSQFMAEGYLLKCTRLRHILRRHLFGSISSSSFLHCTALPHPRPVVHVPTYLSNLASSSLNSFRWRPEIFTCHHKYLLLFVCKMGESLDF